MKPRAHTITITAALVAMTMVILLESAGPSMSATAATSVGTFAGTLGGRRTGAIPLVQAGMRLTFWAGTSAVAGAQGPLQPDANGNWQDPATGKRYAQGASASMGYQQVNIEDVVDGRAIVDVRHYLVDAATNAVTNYKTEGYEFTPQSGGDYWISPKQLASMVETGTGNTVHRLAYPLNGHTYNAIRITTKAILGATTGGTQRTYDLDTGVLISYGSSYMAPGTRSDGNGGVVDSGSTPYLAQIFLVGMRLTTLPWIGERAGPEVQAQRRATFSGTYTTTFEGVPPTTARLTQQWDISKADAVSVTMRISTQLDPGSGIAPRADVVDRLAGIATIWIDPQVLRGLRRGQVLDEDPVTKIRITVLGVQDATMFFGEEGTLQTSSTGFDLRTGLMTAVQVQTRNGPGTITVLLRRTS